jgi:predicted DCC family thiol-disulfide oxidoreductase YuxK
MKSIKIEGKTGTYFIFPEEKQYILQNDARFGKTFLGFRQSDGFPFIVKHFKPKTNEQQLLEIYFHQEALIKDISSNISSSIELVHHKEHIFLIKEYIEGIDLKTVFKSFFYQSKTHKTRFILKTILNVLHVLEDIHKHKIVHCDLKPANILLAYRFGKIDRNDPQAKIIDFGLSKTTHFHPDNSAKVPFNILYSAPEKLLYMHEYITPAADIYSIGIMLFEGLTGKHPFSHRFPHMIIDQQMSMGIPKSKHLSEPISNIIQKSTHRTLFPKPAHYYSFEQKRHMIQQGIYGRYKSANEMAIDIQEVLNEMQNKYHSYGKKEQKKRNLLKEHPIVIFDSECILCERALKWLLKYDKTRIFRYTSLQSNTSKELQQKYTFPNNNQSVILIVNGRLYTKSDAFLKIITLLGGWRILFAVLYILPPFLRNLVYDIIAKNRYKWFGKKSTCYIPRLQEKYLFLG